MKSGQEAIEHYKKHQGTALILMDYHMPELNGIETTKLIRKIEKKNKLDNVPIIAVTADAMKNTSEKCLRAGMDDYITKPVLKTQLIDKIKKHIKKAESTPMQETDWETDPNLTLSGPVDLAHLRDFTEGNVEDEKEFFGIFIEQAEATFDALEISLKEKNNNEWQKAAHKLKGASANLGAKALAKLCHEAETISGKNSSNKKEVLDNISKELARVKAFILEVHE
jgi:CheY-like chemotaxis protein/HPt (histidine-containing phosphotransfer) domain-containing protein